MSSPIQVLPDSLITKIAAGEVVERPASVVKELVENSLDSGATEITVQMEQGGRDSLFVADNGSGMNAEDLRMAIQRHATSKIKKEEDLFQIQTLGFRGEALAAIASISFLRIESRKKGEETGSFIELEGGKVVKEGKISIPIGTRIFIRQLFFNTPARLKFLKNPETEGNHILDLIQSYALISPKIAFHLKQNQKEEIEVRAGETFEERVCSLFGEQVSKSLLPYEGAVSQIKAAGFCSSPGLTSGTRRSLFFFVNGRLVKDRVLQHAVLSAYESLLMKGRFPWVILYLEIPYQYVDVNVHPTKAEVRFTNGSVVHDAVRGVIRKKLGSLNEGVGAALQHYVPNPSQPPLTSRGGEGVPPLDIRGGQGELANACVDHPGHSSTQFSFSQSPYGSLRVLGQVHKTYLVCESENALVLIDQHAAHERIGFEKLKKQFQEGKIQSQRLLIPINVDLTPSETALLKEYTVELLTLGLEVDFFGGNTFVIRSVPDLLFKADYQELIRDLVAEISSFDKLTPLREKIYEVLERMACHRQVRAGDRLSEPEINALLQELEVVPFSSNCPHGRPVCIELSWNDLEKGFKRKL